MSSKVWFQWPDFMLEWKPANGAVLTRYISGEWSGSLPVPDDAYHAERLGITPELHRLEHELAHHLVGLNFYKFIFGSPIIYRDAHKQPQPEREAELEEWMTTALQYHSHGRKADFGALVDLQGAGADVNALSRQLRALMDLAASPIPGLMMRMEP